MCGILAYYSIKEDENVDKERFNSALSLLNHRGPDNIDMAIVDKVALGHVRLSIIELTNSGNQPFVSTDGRYTLVYNGEIFNYLEIKKSLEDEGVVFRTNSDTEVLLQSYIKYGEDCVNQFNGMWAFAIYDSVSKTLFCSRDRFGIKPLYYVNTGKEIIIASEIKSILKYNEELAEPNYNIIANYLRTSVGVQNGITWFDKIKSVMPAHNINISDNNVYEQRYWDYPRKVNRDISFEDAVKRYRELFIDAVNIRLRSDVPIGITLSSGIDSTSIASVVSGEEREAKMNTYTASFRESNYSKEEKQNYKSDIKIDEAELVTRFCNEKNLNSKLIEINYDNYVENLKTLIYHLESGHGSPAIYPLDQVMSSASNEVTVVLEGQGADELLGGYINVAGMVQVVNYFRRFKFKRAINEIRNLKKDYPLFVSFILLVRQFNINLISKIFFSLNGIEKLYEGKIKRFKKINDFPYSSNGFDDYLNKYLYRAHTGGLVNLLHYGDAISMKHSLESRLPFMDYRLVEFGFSLPSEFKVEKGQGKYIHRIAMKGIAPSFILENKLKFGFDSPLSEILFKDGDNSVKSILLSRRCLDRGLFNEEVLKRMFTKERTGLINKTRYLYRALCVELWFREFID